MSTRRAADLLRGDDVEHLACYVGREATVSMAATALTVPLHRAYRAAQRLADAGLMEVAREEARGGRAIKWYRAVSDEFVVPSALQPESRLAKELRAHTEVMIRGFEMAMPTEFDDMPLRVRFPTEHGRRVPVRDYTPTRIRELGQPQPFTWFTSGRHYRREDAVALVAALRRVVDDFEDRSVPPGAPGAQPWILSVAMLPDPHEE